MTTLTVQSSITLRATASASDLKEALRLMTEQEWEQVTFAFAHDPEKPFTQCPRNKFVLNWISLDTDDAIILTEW